jgi:hypothetical protein
VAGGGAIPWRSGGEAVGIELTDVGRTWSSESGRRAGRRRTGEGGGRAGVDVETRQPCGGGLVRAVAERACGPVVGHC